MCHDLRSLRSTDPLVVELQMLTTHRTDLAIDRTRTIKRLRARLATICPELEAALDFTCHGPLQLIAEIPTTAAIRAIGRDELQRWLRAHKVRNAAALATRAHAATGQQTWFPGEDVAALLITHLARTVLTLNRELATAKPSSPSPAAASTSCGPCSATSSPTSTDQPTAPGSLTNGLKISRRRQASLSTR
jgi:hypothetical protein